LIILFDNNLEIYVGYYFITIDTKILSIFTSYVIFCVDLLD